MFMTAAFQRCLLAIESLVLANSLIGALLQAERLIDLAMTEGETAFACSLYDEIALMIDEECQLHGLN